MASVLDLENADQFRQFLQNIGSGVAVIHFWADWAPQCQQMTDALTELNKDTQLQHVKFTKVEAEKVPEISHKYEIAAVPTIIIIKNQVVADRVNGANVPELTSKVQKHAASSAAYMGGAVAKPPSHGPPSKEELNARLTKLTKTSPVMLFIKGTPLEPKCGFSKTVIQLLKEQNVTYSSFNILADNDVRQGLKEFSNWPTFPQLYISGEFVGGLDIIKEQIASGEFQDMLPKKETLDNRLKALINKESVMLFMKGNPDTPKCGFSRTITTILGETGLQYGHFDILTDEEVRQGLKAYSDWPTYPQLYVKGDLIGGLDIIKELKESGELESTLAG